MGVVAARMVQVISRLRWGLGRTCFSGASGSDAKLDGGVASLTLEDPAKVLLVVKTTSITDLLDAKIGAAQQFTGSADLEVKAVLVWTRAGVFSESPAKARVADVEALSDVFERHVAGLFGKH